MTTGTVIRIGQLYVCSPTVCLPKMRTADRYYVWQIGRQGGWDHVSGIFAVVARSEDKSHFRSVCEQIQPLLERPTEWPSREPTVSYHDFAYQAQS